MTPRVLVSSFAIHALVGLALLRIASERDDARPARNTTRIELAEVVAFAEPASRDPERIGDRAASEPTDRARRTARSRDTSTDGSRRAINVRSEDPRGALRFESSRGSGADGDSTDDGVGGGRGRGGLGDIAPITRTEPLLRPPPAPRASRARPARLVYPTRQRDADDAELFLARVTVDDDGYVVGAKLVRGFGGRRDAMASDLIWRFRYAPALDDDGHPMTSTVEQRFLVGN